MTRLILSGNEWYHILPYVAARAGEDGSPWRTRNGVPLCATSVRRYQRIARAKIAEDAAETRQDALKRHVDERRECYRQAMRGGDTRTALAILDSLARLQGLTPEGELAEQLRLAREHEDRLFGAAHGDGASAGGGRLPGAVPPTNGHGHGH